jgi:predicted metal-binding membrane protein
MTDAALEVVLRRDRVVVGAALALVIALAWAYVLWLAAHMATPSADMPGMDMGPGGMEAMAAPALERWTPADFGFMAAMWAVMMVGMMTPSAAPMILLYASVGRQAQLQGKPFAATAWFACGYLLAWTTFAILATAAQWALEQAALVTPMMASANNVFGGSVLVAAGLFQWTPIKNACLSQCQAPLIFIQRHGGFQRDVLGSLWLGIRHGGYCIGCCWALMALLFVGGVMNVLWIAGITSVVLLEKLLLSGQWMARVVGAVLIAAGAWLLLSAMPPLA